MDSKKAGERLANLLSSKGLRQKDLAKQLQVSDNMPSYWIHGRRQPTLEQYVDMASYFEVSLDYLVGLSDTPALHPSLVDELGLSESAVNRLIDIAHDPDKKALFQTLFETDEFYSLVNKLVSVADGERRN